TMMATTTTFSAIPENLFTGTKMPEQDAGNKKVEKKIRGKGFVTKRRQNRIAAMQFLYAWGETSTHGDLADELYEFFSVNQSNNTKTADDDEGEPQFAFADTDKRGNSREFYAFAESLITGTLKNLTRIDETISDAAQNWQIKRIARCDLAILRLAIYELLYRTDIPPVVSINEAIELAKIYSTDDSHKFVNGILEAVKKCLTRPLRAPQK
ncbi:MAG: transcription antitermination factor NusB, partial [Opitutae bacterium]|nr:transcription antitermination factor NusB [Opitutae bacterium]